MTGAEHDAVRDQTAWAVQLAACLDVDALTVLDALDRCRLRVQRDRGGAPGTAADLLRPRPAPATSTKKTRKKGTAA